MSSVAAEEYTGGRTANDIVTWSLDKHTENLPPPEIKQVLFIFFPLSML